MRKSVLICGAGFGGLELSTMLSESFGDEVEVTLIEKSDSFVFGYSKLDVMFGRASLRSVELPYSEIAKPGVRLLRETITAIDPEAKRVTTDAGEHTGDYLVIALGADYDFEATPGLTEGGNEFYSVAGAERLGEVLPAFRKGHALVAVADAPFKCPPAPSECAFLLHDWLSERSLRGDCEITFTLPLGSPVPPAPDASAVIKAELDQRGIEFIPGRRFTSIDPDRRVAVFDDGSEIAFDLFLGVPKHRAPDVVINSGMTEDGYVPVDFATLETRYPGVFAVGDVATAGVPKAGVFSEGAARVVAKRLIAEISGEGEVERHLGQGACYIEFGGDRVARVDIDFLSGPERTGSINGPSAELVAEKQQFGATRRARWFGLD